MQKRYTQVPLDYLKPIFSEWRSTYSHGDTLSVFFMPYGDHLFRALQFADYMNEQFGEEIAILNLEAGGISPENLEVELANHEHQNIVIVAKREFLLPEAKAFEVVLETWHAKTGLGVVILHEGFPAQLANNISSTILMQKIKIHGLYPRDVAIKFVFAVAEQFDHEMTRELAEKIVDYCGGCTWLIVDVLRRYDIEHLFDNPIFEWKVGKILSQIPGNIDLESDLRNVGLKNANGKWLPAFEDYINRTKLNTLRVSSEKVLCDQIDLTREFSLGERKVLSLLLSDKSKVYGRDELGTAFWGERSEEYSDWALDAIMSRLRKKIVRQKIPIKIITYRGRGYGSN